jgi:hypothetical protein
MALQSVVGLSQLFQFRDPVYSQLGLEYGNGDPLHWPRDTLLPAKVDINFTDKPRSLGRYSSLAD